MPFLKCGTMKNTNNQFSLCTEHTPSALGSQPQMWKGHTRLGHGWGTAHRLLPRPEHPPSLTLSSTPPRTGHSSCRIPTPQLSPANSSKSSVDPTDAGGHRRPELPRLPPSGSGSWGQRGSVKPKGRTPLISQPLRVTPRCTRGRLSTGGARPRWGWHPHVRSSDVCMGTLVLLATTWGLLFGVRGVHWSRS